MLTDDELDFEDFGDLGELEGPELTAEELEKQLELEFAKETEQVVAEPTEKPTTTTADVKDVVVEFEEGEMNEAEIKASEKANIKKPEETKREEIKTSVEQDSRPSNQQQQQQSQQQQQQQQQQRYNNNRGNYNNGQGYYSNYNGNNDYYAQQKQQQLKYIPDSMAMNSMFPQYPPYSNRIYVNPKFNNAANTQQQQMLQKRQFIEMEAQRMIMMQQQIQLEQEKQRLAELDRKRREAAENLKKRKEIKDHHVGEKRDRDQTEQEEQERQPKRINARPAIAKGVFSIKGAASRNQQASSSRNVPYTPPHQKQHQHDDIRNRLNTPSTTERPNIASRLNQPSSYNQHHQNDNTNNNNQKPTPSSILSNPIVPIVTNGKSNILIVTGLSKDTKEDQIRDMTNTMSGGAKDIKFDSGKMTATVTFESVENAVTFRRKYNRLLMGDSHISIVFQK